MPAQIRDEGVVSHEGGTEIEQKPTEIEQQQQQQHLQGSEVKARDDEARGGISVVMVNAHSLSLFLCSACFRLRVRRRPRPTPRTVQQFLQERIPAVTNHRTVPPTLRRRISQ